MSLSSRDETNANREIATIFYEIEIVVWKLIQLADEGRSCECCRSPVTAKRSGPFARTGAQGQERRQRPRFYECGWHRVSGLLPGRFTVWIGDELRGTATG